MSVNHYVVSWIQVLGLVVGLLGFFYVSVGLFGKAGKSLLRPLLPALALAIVGAVGPLVVSIPGQGRDPVTVLVTALVCFAAGYFMGYFGQKPQRDARMEVFRLASFGFVVVAIMAVVVLLEWQVPSEVVALAVFIAVFVVVVWVTLELPAHLTERHVIQIGIVATVLAFLTQFIPPLLDLLNISIR